MEYTRRRLLGAGGVALVAAFGQVVVGRDLAREAVGAPGDDVDHPTRGTRAIARRGRAADDLDAFDQFGGHPIGIAARVALASGDAALEQLAGQAALLLTAFGASAIAGRLLIGRGSDADITIADAGTSRRHVEILWDGERAMVRDLGSTNGTYIGAERIGEHVHVDAGTRIRIGRTVLELRK